MAAAASFGIGRLPTRYFELLHSLGHQVPPVNPPTLFEGYRRGETFDRVITMCREEAGEYCRIFGASVGELYGRNARIHNWSVPDISPLPGSRREQEQSLSRIAGELELKIQALIGELAGEAAPQQGQQG